MGKFTVQDPNWWKHINIQTYEGYWGGETAAAIYTKHLRPQVATVYVPKENLSKLIRDARLSNAAGHEQDKGKLVYLYSPFWSTATKESLDDDFLKEIQAHWSVNVENADELVNPIIVYADLIATGDPRNLETAQVLSDEYIAEPDE